MPRVFTKRPRSAKNCPLCAAKTEVDYKDVVLLRRYISERGKILGRVRTGICAKHQRQIRRAVINARLMALLPFSQT